jgi:putative transposase
LIEPTKPWQNGVAASFNGKFPDECLSLEWFRSRAEAHSSLGYLTPNEFVAQQANAASRQATGQRAAVCGPSRPGPLLNPLREEHMQQAREAVSPWSEELGHVTSVGKEREIDTWPLRGSTTLQKLHAKTTRPAVVALPFLSRGFSLLPKWMTRRAVWLRLGRIGAEQPNSPHFYKRQTGASSVVGLIARQEQACASAHLAKLQM